MTSSAVRPTRLADIEAVFHAVLAEPPERRAVALAERTAGDGLLRRAVERLLRADSSENGFLETPVLGPGFRLSALEGVGDGAAGQRVGPYQLIRPLGSGGMAHVWLARRVDGEFDKDVAIKLIKRGMDSDAILGRFRVERQVLARLEHPNIARLLDGGATTDGLPYLAMEYVDGVPIDAFCGDRNLPLHERLLLFRRVCSAVQYAHQNLVVHRDVKPGNILVTAAGEPKLLDFGIAGVLAADGSPGVTRVDGGGRLLTPEYASPEQITGGPITTASDVYSLGVVLYELLSGQSPYGVNTASHTDLRRAIVELEPVRPSSRTQSAGLVSLRGDLDTIVMKALRKAPAERYASVEQFAEDVERYLARLPIRARPATWTYRARRFAQRHTGGIVAAAIATAAVLGGLAFSVRAYLQADAAREREAGQRLLAEQRQVEAETAQKRAIDEAAKVRATSEFLQTLLSTDDPQLKLRADIELRELLAEAGRALHRGALAGEPEVEAAARLTIGRTYTQLRIPNQAEPHLRRAVELLESARGSTDLEVADAWAELALSLSEQGKYDEGIPLHRRAIAVQRRLAPHDEAVVIQRLWRLTTALRDNGQFGEAERIARETLEMSRRVHGERVAATAEGRYRLGLVLYFAAKLDEAERELRLALEIQQERLGEAHPACGESLFRLGQVLSRTGRPDEAEALMRDGVRVLREALGAGHPNTMRAMSNFAGFLGARGQLEEAEALFDETVARYTEYYGYETGYVAGTLARKAAVRQRHGDLAGAEALRREALRLNQVVFGAERWSTIAAQLNLTDVLIASARFDEAEALLRSAADAAECAESPPVGAERTVAQRFSNLYEQWQASEPSAERAAALEVWRGRLQALRANAADEDSP